MPTAATTHRPKHYTDADALASAQLATRLPHQLAVCRLVHHLRAEWTGNLGAHKGTAEGNRILTEWLARYEEDEEEEPETEAESAARPLRAAQVQAEEDPRRPGRYRARFAVCLGFQCDEDDVVLRAQFTL